MYKELHNLQFQQAANAAQEALGFLEKEMQDTHKNAFDRQDCKRRKGLPTNGNESQAELHRQLCEVKQACFIDKVHMHASEMA